MSSIVSSLDQNIKLKKFIHKLMVPKNQARPRKWVSWFVNPFIHNKKLYLIDNALAKQLGFSFSENKGKLLENLVFIELKRKTDSANEIKQQLIGAACCFRYIQEIGRRFWNNLKLLTNFEHRYICFRHTESVSKRSTRYSKDSGKHNSPDNIFKIDWPKKNIIFNHLAGA